MIRVLYVHVGRPGEAGWLTTHPQVCAHVTWSTLAINHEGSFARLWHSVRGLAAAPQVDLIISSEYYLALGVNAWLKMSGLRTPHIVWGLNQSRQLMTQPLLHPLANRLFARSTLIVTHSLAERTLFQRLHCIPAQKFRFVRWGFDLPAVSDQPFSSTKPYVCLVGRNNRDIETFAQACQRAGLRGEVISSPLPIAQVTKLAEMGVGFHANLSFERCLACIRDSQFSAVLLNDDERGAGHITMVAAMLLGKAQVVSDAQVIADYVDAPDHALKVRMNDVEDCARAFDALSRDHTLRHAMEHSAVVHAQTHCSNDAVARAFIALSREAVGLTAA